MARQNPRPSHQLRQDPPGDHLDERRAGELLAGRLGVDRRQDAAVI
jgi:hypothetical protein